jgi:hypothetical protein
MNVSQKNIKVLGVTSPGIAFRFSNELKLRAPDMLWRDRRRVRTRVQ